MTDNPFESFQYFDEPDLIVEIAWTDNYAESFPNWTDITGYVQGFNYKYGRSTEIGSNQTGVVNLSLDNSGGEFTPGNPASPFYPNVKPRRQVRVRVDDGTDGADHPTLTNLVRNPMMVGDSTGSGFSTYPLTPVVFDYRGDYNAWGGRFDQTVTIMAWADNAATEHFPCSPGQYVSARYAGDTAAFFGANAHFVLTVTFRDADGYYVDQTVHDVPASFPGYTEPLQVISVENLVVPVGATCFEFSASDSNTQFGEFSHMAAYLTDAPQAWPDGVPFVSGDDATTDDAFYTWSGTPNASPTWVFSTDTLTSGLGRGYVERWPVEYSGLTGEVTVPVVDWLAEFGTRPLVRPLEHAYGAKPLADLFKFDDSGSRKGWASSVNPLKYATSHLLFREDSPIYENDGHPVPKIEGGKSPINAIGLDGENSIRTVDQTHMVIRGQDYPLGVSVDVPIPEIKPGTDSFSFAFVWKIFALLAGEAAPAAITLYDSRKVFGSGSGISYYPYDNQNSALALWGPDGTVYSVGTGFGQMYHAPVFGGFSWDAEHAVLRTAWNDQPYVGSAELKAQLPSGQTVADFMGSLRLDKCQVLGFSDKNVYQGFADQAMQYLGRWDSALTTADFVAMNEAVGGLEGQTASERIDYILDMVGWPRALRRIAESSSRMGRAGWETGTDSLEWLNHATDSVLGSLYVDPTGFVRFVDRYARIGEPVSHVFDHDAGTGVESGLTFESAEDDIINTAKINNAYGVNTTIANDDSIRDYGVRSKSFELHLQDDNEAVQLGYHMVNRNGEPRVRVQSASFNPSASAYGLLWGHALGVRLGQRITLDGLPDTAPAPSMDFFVESVEHAVTRSGDRLVWLVTLELSPGEAAPTGWVLGDSELSRLGHTTRLMF